MYLERFQLREDPFGATADPRFFFPSETHSRVLSQAVSATRAGSSLQTLISPPGLGKTSLLLRLFQEMPTFHWAYRWTPMSTASELYRSVLSDMGVNHDAIELPALRRAFLKAVHASEGQHHAFILVLDEAQNLSDSVLKELAELIEQSPGRPQLILSGQPRLSSILRSAAHATLTTRLKGEHVLAPLTPNEVSAYINHRLRVAGYSGSGLFNEGAIALIAPASAGVPRVINNICWTAMSGSEALNQYGEADVRRALEVLRIEPSAELATPLSSKDADLRATTAPMVARIDPVLLSSALQTWMRKKVRWSGTAAELLSDLSAETRVALDTYRPRPEDLVESLKNQRVVLSSHGIVVEFLTRQGLPQQITLHSIAPPKLPVGAATPTETTPSIQRPEGSASPAQTINSVQQARVQQRSNNRRNRWRAIHVWVFTSLLVLTAATVTVYRRSQSSFVRAAETRPVPDPGDQELQRERRSAVAGNVAAQKTLALRYLRGDGVPEDRANGLQWLREAAKSHDVEAQYLLGLNLITYDKLEAYKWLVISHLNGNERSFGEIQRLTHELTPAEIGKVRYDLGLAYASGEGTDIDYVRAYTWMILAAAAGVSESKERLAEFAQKMSQEEINNASRQSSAWLARMRAPQNQDRAAKD